MWFETLSYICVLWSPIHFELQNDNPLGNALAPTNPAMREYTEHIQINFYLIK